MAVLENVAVSMCQTISAAFAGELREGIRALQDNTAIITCRVGPKMRTWGHRACWLSMSGSGTHEVDTTFRTFIMLRVDRDC